MSERIVPNWNLKHQRQQQVEGEEGNIRSSHVHSSSRSHLIVDPIPMSNYEVTELKWENGQLAMHGLGGLLPNTPTKPTWGRSNETLESIVHQATCTNKHLNIGHHQTPTDNMISSIVASSCGKRGETSGQAPTVPTQTSLKKRTQSDPNQCERSNFSGCIFREDQRAPSTCASASATFGRDNGTTMMTWASYESPMSLKTKSTYEDSANCQDGPENRDEDKETKGDQTRRSHSSRRSRAAATHNQYERRRRDRINQKMKTLQKLVPNASKTDKASMLDEVINYLKQLQAQVQMMSMRNKVNNMPQMMMQQQLQMSLLAQMAAGMGMGMGMLDINAIQPRSQSLPPLIHPTPPPPTHMFLPFPPSFVLPPIDIAPRAAVQANHHHQASVPLTDPAYCAFLAQQAMRVDLYNKMVVLYRQQINQSTQTTCSLSQTNHVEGD